ncbi:hypothetical protein BOTBODRAFT_29882 [Botryobasidium botryosum FD-172 SS1]|uniref:Uncharacterized protein n=1 Tax=Botryobasidium botryosum (strain FD-172 SS1) TaxID=930990 RepID=A0A067MQ67_BOTB1|nr:hypothetical protein BOTBODRAFT_29882 [Botryobasidium botryosum FD-172 SS1]
MPSLSNLYAAVWSSPVFYRRYERELNALHAGWEASRKYHREQMEPYINTLTMNSIFYTGPASGTDYKPPKSSRGLFVGYKRVYNRAQAHYPIIQVCAGLRQWREAIYALEYILFAKNALKTLYNPKIFMGERYHRVFDLMMDDIRKLGPPPPLAPATPRLNDMEIVSKAPPIFFDAPSIPAFIDALGPEKRPHMDAQINSARATVKWCPSFFM